MTKIRFVVILAAILFGAATFAYAQMRLATDTDRATAQLAISLDGQTVTLRSVARDTTRVCFEQREGEFGPTRCYTIGAIRRGEVVQR